jgi:hypothetical protein
MLFWKSIKLYNENGVGLNLEVWATTILVNHRTDGRVLEIKKKNIASLAERRTLQVRLKIR